jgi:hypothetical protein
MADGTMDIIHGFGFDSATGTNPNSSAREEKANVLTFPKSSITCSQLGYIVPA